MFFPNSSISIPSSCHLSVSSSRASFHIFPLHPQRSLRTDGLEDLRTYYFLLGMRLNCLLGGKGRGLNLPSPSLHYFPSCTLTLLLTSLLALPMPSLHRPASSPPFIAPRQPLHPPCHFPLLAIRDPHDAHSLSSKPTQHTAPPPPKPCTPQPSYSSTVESHTPPRPSPVHIPRPSNPCTRQTLSPCILSPPALQSLHPATLEPCIP
ncbi:hypothetical protein F4861DRAFT_522251 [Xylaria intraflava]|nr:hypothetical protein F4861DRAFT_522251 [Xylaria intraflava]